MSTEHPAFQKLLAERPALAACYHAARNALAAHFRGKPEALPRALEVFALNALHDAGAEVAKPECRADNEGFKCLSCGNCCRLPGYVRLHGNEAENIAKFLGKDATRFIQTQTRVTADRRHLSLLENDVGVCAFLTPDSLCAIHPVKPEQCRGYPWRWRSDVLDLICAGRCALSSQADSP